MLKRSSLPISGLAFLLILVLVACHGFFVNPVLTSITLKPANPSIGKGGTQQFTATGTNDDGSTVNPKNLTWTSSDKTIATVNSSGLAKAVTPGSATITATSGTVSGTATLTVTASALTSISITAPSSVVSLGSTDQFTATGTFADGSSSTITNSVTWNTSNQNVVTIDSQGLATANSTTTGSATITATSSSGSVTSNAFTITVQ